MRLAVQELERAVEEIEASQGRNRGRIGLGLLPLAGAFFVARALKDLGEAYPDTRMEVIDGSFDFLIERLRSGGIDFIIGPVRGLDPSLGVVETVLFDDRYALVVRRGHPLTRKRQIRRQDLLAYDWVAPPPDTPRRVVYDALFAGLDRVPRSTLQTSSPNLTRAILTETDCITLLSRLREPGRAGDGLPDRAALRRAASGAPGAGHHARRLAADRGAGAVPAGAARSGARPGRRRSRGAA